MEEGEKGAEKGLFATSFSSPPFHPSGSNLHFSSSFPPPLSLCGWVGVPTEPSHPLEEEEEARPTSIPPSIHPFVVHNNTVMLPERKRGEGGLLTFALMKEGANKTITHEKQC